MALQATRRPASPGNPAATVVTGANAMDSAPPVNPPAAPAQAAPVHAPPAVVQNPSAPAQLGDKAPSVAQMNAGVLEGVDNLSTGNYVKIDGESIVLPDGQRLREIDILVSYGKKDYKFVDESDPANKRYFKSDTKLNDNYKLNFTLIWWMEDENGEAQELQLSLSETSAINFIEYLKKLTKAGYGVNQVVTKITVSRESNPGKGWVWSKAQFQAFTMDGTIKICGTV